MQNFIPLVVVKDGPGLDLLTADQIPVVKLIPGDAIQDVLQATFGSVLKMSKNGRAREVQVLESPLEIKASENPSSSDLHVQNVIDAAVTAAGSTQGAGYAIAKYFTNVTTATDTTAEALDLPAATVGAVFCVKNATAVELEVFPASTEIIDGAAADAVRLVAANTTVYFGCVVAGEWISSVLN
jgi:hypothetical protein